MTLYLEIVESPDTRIVGSRVKIIDGLRIGRKGAELVIHDENISSLHAKIEQVGNDRFALVDTESHNGIHLNGIQVKRVTLIPDVLFLLGRTTIKVVRQSNASIQNPPLLRWDERFRENLNHFLKNLQHQESEDLFNPNFVPPERVGPYFQNTEAFHAALRLLFSSGIQADQEYVLGYGPRRAGFRHLDIDLQEPNCPNEIFEIRNSANKKEMEILIFDKDFLLINGESLDRTILKNGDVLMLGKTKIQIEFVGLNDSFS